MKEGQRSTGAGGAFGTTSNISVCAVVGCNDDPKPHTCPYCQNRHRHGAIHYSRNDHTPPGMEFREGDWYWMCDKHYQECEAHVA